MWPGHLGWSDPAASSYRTVCRIGSGTCYSAMPLRSQWRSIRVGLKSERVLRSSGLCRTLRSTTKGAGPPSGHRVVISAEVWDTCSVVSSGARGRLVTPAESQVSVISAGIIDIRPPCFMQTLLHVKPKYPAGGDTTSNYAKHRDISE